MGLAQVLHGRFQLSTVPTHVDLTQFCLYSCNIKPSRLNGFEMPPDAPWKLNIRGYHVSWSISHCLNEFGFLHVFLENLWSSWVRRTVQAGVLCMAWWTVVRQFICAHSGPFRLRFLPWKLQKASSVWLRHWNAECGGKALGHARKKAQIVIVTSDQLWPIYLCTLQVYLLKLCMMENVPDVEVACLWLCLCCISCGLEFEIAFVCAALGKLVLTCWEFQIIRLLLRVYWPSFRQNIWTFFHHLSPFSFHKWLVDLVGLMRQQPNLGSEIR